MKAGAKVGLMTSRMGSIADNSSGNKVWLPDQFSCMPIRYCWAQIPCAGSPWRRHRLAILHPGWVKTDMTGHSGHLTKEDAAAALVKRMDELTLENVST